MGTNGTNANESKKNSFYVTIDGKAVALTDEQRNAWNKMANDARRYARDFGACGQPDYRKCCGDCALCAFQQAGAFIFADDRERYADGFAEGPLAPLDTAPTPEDRAVANDTWEWLYTEADKLTKSGRDILSLHLEEGLSERKIGDRLGIPWPPVHSRLNKLLAFIREHREDLI